MPEGLITLKIKIIDNLESDMLFSPYRKGFERFIKGLTLQTL